MKRILAISLVAIIALSGLTSAANAADPFSDASITLNGSPAADLSSGTVVLTTDAAVTQPGTSTQVIEQLFDTNSGSVNAKYENGQWIPDVTYPEGYTLEYLVDGTWTSTVPQYDGETGTFWQLQGVRATGSLNINGYANGLEQHSRLANSVSTAMGGFQGSSGGDGWDVFFGSGSARGRVFNIYHHNSILGIDCHVSASGSACWGGAYYATTSFYTAAQSTGYYDDATDSIYVFVGSSDGSFGIACVTDASTSAPRDCDTPYYALSGNVGATSVFSWNGPGESAKIGSKIYGHSMMQDSPIYCFDVSTQAACSENPINVGPLSSTSYGSDRLQAIGTDLYFSTGYELGCYDTVTNALCAAWNNGAVLSTSVFTDLFNYVDANGDVIGICAWGSANCWDLSGAEKAWPSGLQMAYSSINDGWGAALNVRTHLYYWENDTAACYDFATDAPCAGFNTNMPSLGYAYAMALDPSNSNCIWANADSGHISTFNADDGQSPCGKKAEVEFRYPDALPRLSCDESGRVTSYTSMVVTAPAGVDVSAGRVTVYDENMNAIDGWVGVALDANGFLDLSTLTVLKSTVHPTFRITFDGFEDAGGTTAIFTYDSAAPQICTNFVVRQAWCPEGSGSGAADFPYSVADMFFDSTVTNTLDGGSPVVEQNHATATRAGLTAADCLVSPHGNVYIGQSGGDPAPGLRVSLVDPAGNVLGTATTDANGYYEFNNFYPGAFRVVLRTSATDSATIYPGWGSQLTDLVLPLSQAQPRVPSEPLDVTADWSGNDVVLNWGVPVDSGDSDVTSYVVTAYPNGPSCTATAPATTCTITGLDPKVSYTFSVHAVNAAGAGRDSSKVQPLAPAKGSLKYKGKLRMRVFFESGKADLLTTQRQALLKLKKQLPAGARVTGISIVGYVQKTVSTANDISLSKARAKIVKRFLQVQGFHTKYNVKARGILNPRDPARTSLVTLYFEAPLLG